MQSRLQSLLHRFAGCLPYLAGGLAAVSVVLGYAGFRAVPGDDGPMRWDDAVYQSLGLFVMECNASAPGGLPLSLNIARFLSPALTGYAAVRAGLILLSGFHERLRRKGFHGHRVVCGLGARGRFVAINAAEGGRDVVAIDPHPDQAVVTACEHRRISLIRGDAADSSILREAGIERASEVYIFTRDDNVNLEIAHAVRRTRSGAKNTRSPEPLECYLSIGEIRLAALIPAHRRFLEFPANMRVHGFNSHLNAARDLWERMIRLAIDQDQCLPLRMDDSRAAHVVVIGASNASHAVFSQIAGQAHFANGKRTCLTLIGRDASIVTSDFSQVLDVRVIDEPVASAEAVEAWTSAASDAESLTSIVICDESDTTGLRLALEINERARKAELDVPVFVLTSDAAGIHEFLAGEMEHIDHLRNVHGFGVLADTCSIDAILQPRGTELAKLIHARFLGKGHIPSDKGAWEESWNKLEEHLREANRAAAEHIRIKSLALGCDSDAGEIPDAAEIENHLENLAELEHRRWMAGKLLAGWKAGEETNSLTQTHRDLCHWDDLKVNETTGEDPRDKDRSQVRAIPELLRRLQA